MKIYIVFPGPAHPIVGQSQVRMYNLIKTLSLDHELVFSDIRSKPAGLEQTRQAMEELGIDYRPIFSSRFNKSKPIKAIAELTLRIRLLFSAKIREQIVLETAEIRKQILNIIDNIKPDAFMINYWYLGYLFKQIDKSLLKFIDTHYLVEEHHELMREGKYKENYLKKMIHKRKLNCSLKTQREYFLQTDLVIAISHKAQALIKEWNPQVRVNVTVIGNDLEKFLNYKNPEEPETAVLFFGSLANQFNRRALSRILTDIFPLIKASIPECKFYIVGANPPADILGKIKDDSIIVTGYVDDIKPHLTKCKVMLLPLDTGSGFRGRAVELLALGIPIVGTQNGLQSIGFIDGELGFMAETNEEIAAKTIELLQNQELWAKMSNNSRLFAKQHFSLENTFGRLSSLIAGFEKDKV